MNTSWAVHKAVYTIYKNIYDILVDITELNIQLYISQLTEVQTTLQTLHM